MQSLGAIMSQPPLAGQVKLQQTLLGDLISYYQEGAGEGQLRVCRQAALTRGAQLLLGTGIPPRLCLPEDVAPHLGTTNFQGASSPAQHVCRELVWALEFLELISVNLRLSPWRKEIRSLKVGTAMPLSKRVSGRGKGSASASGVNSVSTTDFGPIL